MRTIIITLLLFFGALYGSAQTASKADSLKTLLKQRRGDTSAVKVYIKIVNELKLQSPVEALRYAREGLNLAARINYHKGQINLYSEAGPIHAQLGWPDSTEIFLKKALTISKQQRLLRMEVYSLKALSEFYRGSGKFDEALKGFDELEHKAKQNGISDIYASAFYERGTIYWRKNDPVKAITYMKKAVTILDTLQPNKEFAYALMGIAHLYKEMNHSDKAMETFAKLIGYCKKLYPGQEAKKDNIGAAGTLMYITDAYIQLSGKDPVSVYLDSALANLERGTKLSLIYDYKKGLALSYKKYGEVYFLQKKYDLSESYSIKSLDLYTFLKNTMGKLFVLNDLCSLYVETKEYSKMEPCLKEAIKIAQLKGDDAELKKLFLSAAKLYEKTKDWEKAYKHRLIYENLSKKLYNAENNKAMNEMLAKYETEAKENENLLLQKENALSQETIKNQKTQTWFIIGGSVLILLLIFFILRAIKLQRDNYSLKVKEQQVELVSLNEMKTLADLKTLQARINPHFLYNSLNSITSLIHEKPDQAEEMTIKLSRLFRYSINTQEANWATVKDELTIVETYLDIERVRFGNRITFDIKADESLLNIMIPRFLLQPLVENALKHGLKDINDNGTLRVNLTDKQELIEINVYDNGIPFPADMMAGYGLQSINDKLNLLCGNSWKMNFINKGGKRICIELPKYANV